MDKLKDLKTAIALAHTLDQMTEDAPVRIELGGVNGERRLYEIVHGRSHQLDTGEWVFVLSLLPDHIG